MNKDSLNNIITKDKKVIDDLSSDKENIEETSIYYNKFKNNTISLNNNSINNIEIKNKFEYQYQKLQKKQRLKLKLLIFFYILSGCFLLIHSFHYIFSRNVRDKYNNKLYLYI